MDNQLMNTSTIETIDSREVAEMIEVRHDNLVKKDKELSTNIGLLKIKESRFFRTKNIYQ